MCIVVVSYIHSIYNYVITYIPNSCTYQYISRSLHLSPLLITCSSVPGSPLNEVFPWPTPGMKRSWIRSLRIQQRALRAWLAWTKPMEKWIKLVDFFLGDS